MASLPPTLLSHLSQSLASFPGSHHFSLQVVRSQPRRSHALFPHASNVKTKVWQEEVLVILSQEVEVPVLSPAAPVEKVDKEGDNSADAVGTTAGFPTSKLESIPGSSNGAAPALGAPPSPSASAPVATRLGLVPVCAIESSIYTIPSTRTALLYISKVDTTGLGTSPISPTRSLVSSFLSYHLLHPPHHCERLRVHIFAKSQGQYLFPGSVENSTKNVLDDKGLMRWWKLTIAQAASSPEVRGNADARSELFYLIPGYSYADSLPYLPDNPSSEPKWTYGHPYSKIGSPLDPPGATPSAPAPITDLIPAFPDDPKARFLTSLGSSSIASSGTEGDYDDVMLSLSSAAFTTGQTSAQKVAEVEQTRERERSRMRANVQGGADEFWVLMEARQECCSAALVGFFVIAREGTPKEQVAEGEEQKRPVKVPGSLPHRLFTTLWGQFHNVDYAKPAIGKLALAADKWRESVKRLVKLDHDPPPPAPADGEPPTGEVETPTAQEAEDDKAEKEGLYFREVAREVRTANAEWEPKKREAPPAKAVNLLAPRKKKPKV